MDTNSHLPHLIDKYLRLEPLVITNDYLGTFSYPSLESFLGDLGDTRRAPGTVHEMTVALSIHIGIALSERTLRRWKVTK